MITCLVCCNAAGDKEPLLFIGKSARPRKFPKNMPDLPLNYTNSKKAWMNSEIWTECLKKWDRKLRVQNRKILLLIDNAPSHPIVSGLINTKIP